MAKRKSPEGSGLSVYENQVLVLVSKGLTNIEIGQELGHIPSSVSLAITNIKEKLGIDKQDLRHALLGHQSREISRLRSMLYGRQG